MKISISTPRPRPALRRSVGMVLAILAGAAQAQEKSGAPPLASQAVAIPPLLHDDETIVVTRHHMRTPRGILRYQARAGRLAIRNDETGEVRGYIYFTAYVVPASGTSRPLTILWNGGPTTDSSLLHTEVFGPRRVTAGGMVDNPETLLTTSDLVFYDPVDTGFSRAGKDTDQEFLSTLGDFAETAEFIRAYRARFAAERQPLFLGGESYGTWRVAGTAQLLERRGTHVAGAILISGGIPGSQMPPSFQDAMYVPARTAAAFALGKLAPDLMRDREATMLAVDIWVDRSYRPALAHVATLSPSEREAIAGSLAHFTGLRPAQIDRETLVMTNNAYKRALFADDGQRILDTYDMRVLGSDMDAEPGAVAGRGPIVTDYLRGELGYRTDLAYIGLEEGYMPVPGPARRSTAERWDYNHVKLTPEVLARAQTGGGPPDSLPWLQSAMRIDPQLRVFVAAGRYDSLNMCEGNIVMAAKQGPAFAARFTNRCYEGGHMMYRVPATRLLLLHDIAGFIGTAARATNGE